VSRLATFFAIFMLALTGTAFAQGAGDDQYQDPFGDEQSQDEGGGASNDDDGGLSDSPPTTSGGSDSGSGSSTSGSGDTTTPPPATTTPSASASGNLPRTGSDPLILMALGAGMVLTGVGLRLRTIDPDAF
jgi:hypothetical protein